MTPSIIERLDNGVGLVVRPMRLAPVVALQLWLDAGAADDPDDFPGMAHLLEHLLFKGNPSRRFHDLVATVEAVGGSFEAWTSHDHTVYELLLPSRQARLGLDILADALGPLSVDPDVLEREMSIITQEERQRADDVWTDAADVLVALAFEGHPYGRSVTGDPRKLRRATVDDVVSFHDRLYRGERMTLVVVGDLEPDDVRRDAAETLGALPGGGEPPARDPVPFPPQARVRTAVDVRGNGLATVGLGFRIPGARDPATPALALLDTVLGDGPASLLQAGLVRARELALHVEVAQYPERDGSVLAVIASVAPDKWSDALDAILDVLALLRRSDVPPVDLERARHLIATEALYGAEAVEDVAGRLGFDALATGDPDYEAVFQAQVAATTAGAVREAAATWLRPANLGAVVVLPQEDDEEISDEDIDAARERIRTAVRDRLSDDEPLQASTEPLDVTLACGARLVIRPEPGVPLVAVDAFFPGGQALESERTAGLQQILSRLLLRGAGGMSAAEIDRAIDEMAASVQPYAGADTLGISATFPAADALRGLALVADALRDPTFPEDEFERERRRLLADLRAAESDPFYVAGHELYPRLLPGHPYRFDPRGTPEALGRITHSSLVRAWNDDYPLHRLTIVVSGDVTPDAVRDTLDARLPSDPRSDAAALQAPGAVEAEVPERDQQVVVHGDFAQAYVLFGFRAPGGESDDRHAVSLLVEALAGDTGILMQEVREGRGLAYDVGAEARLPIGQGVVLVHASCDPRDVDAVLATIDDLLDDLAQNGLGPERLAHAQDLLVHSYALDLQRVSDRNRLAARGLFVHGTVPSFESYEQAIRAVTPDQAREVAADLFDPDNAVTIVVLPQDADAAADHHEDLETD
ncbi:MAG: insulinase family protein [Deltaproteobacteria bacterium]|nr:insulinase family protein [Deltaproteobacteria bacterium]